jgi:DNA polymerase delta subunit 1
VKITVSQHKLIGLAKRQLENSFSIEGLGAHAYDCYETNIEYNLRFMIDLDVVGCNWLELPAGKYRMRKAAAKSLCQLEMDIAYDDFISHATEGVYAEIAPLRVLSFDIECAGRKGIFPEPEIDPVIQIANMARALRQWPPFRRCFVLRCGCSSGRPEAFAASWRWRW